MNKGYLLFFALFLLALPLQAQKWAIPKADEVEQARKLAEEFPDNPLMTLHSDISITFSFNDKTRKVTAKEVTRERFVCLKGDCTHYVYEFYDDESEIKDVEVKYRNGRKKDVEPQKEYYSQDGIFYSDARVCYFELDFPSQGYQYSVEIEKKYKDLKYFTSVYFSKSYPMLSQRIEFRVPQALKLELKEMNFEGFEVKKEERYDASKKEQVIVYRMEKVAATKRESRAKGPSHLYPHVLVLGKEYNKDGERIVLFNTTQDLYNWYHSLVSTIDNNISPLQPIVEELTKDSQNEEDKIKAIYYWIQENIRYIAFEDGIAGFQPENCQSVIKNKYGDCKGMANLTKQMLQLAGLDARLTWIGTRRLAYDYSSPSLAVDNHMICSVLHNGEFVYLDATEEFNELGEYAERIQGRQVLIENGEAFILKTVPVSKAEANKMVLSKKLKIEEETLAGKGRYKFEGESKANFLYKLNNIKRNNQEEALKSYINEEDKSYKVKNVESSTIDSRDGTMTLDYDLHWENAVSSYGDEMYIDLDFSKEFGKFKFSEKRTHDYVFSHKIHRQTIVELEIPEGYQAGFLPENLDKKYTDFEFKVNFEVKDNTLRYFKEIILHKAEVNKASFESWNECIDALDATYEQQIVLKKKS